VSLAGASLNAQRAQVAVDSESVISREALGAEVRVLSDVVAAKNAEIGAFVRKQEEQLTQLAEKFDALAKAFDQKLAKVEDAGNVIDQALQQVRSDFSEHKMSIAEKLSEASLEIKQTSRWGLWSVLLIGQVCPFLVFMIVNFLLVNSFYHYVMPL
jgi:DNA anti-recombination protein RmuC